MIRRTKTRRLRRRTKAHLPRLGLGFTCLEVWRFYKEILGGVKSLATRRFAESLSPRTSEAQSPTARQSSSPQHSKQLCLYTPYLAQQKSSAKMALIKFEAPNPKTLCPQHICCEASFNSQSLRRSGWSRGPISPALCFKGLAGVRVQGVGIRV